MTHEEETGLAALAQELREAFDRSFAEPAGQEARVVENLLEIGLGDGSYAVRMSEVGGLFPDRTTVPLPTAVPELVGLASVRGSLLPVYDLARLVGIASEEPSRWLLVAGGRRLAFACPRFGGYFRVSPDAIVARDRGVDSRVREDVSIGDRVVPLISLESVVNLISRRVSHSSPRQER